MKHVFNEFGKLVGLALEETEERTTEKHFFDENGKLLASVIEAAQ